MSGCPICRADPGDADSVRFGPFVVNQLDPLHFLSASSVHRACLEAHPLGAAALERYHEHLKRRGRGRRFCIACGAPAEGSEGILALPHLVADLAHPLAPYNDALFHLSCLAGFAERAWLAGKLRVLRDSPAWRGPGLDEVIARLAELAGPGPGLPGRG